MARPTAAQMAAISRFIRGTNQVMSERAYGWGNALPFDLILCILNTKTPPVRRLSIETFAPRSEADRWAKKKQRRRKKKRQEEYEYGQQMTLQLNGKIMEDVGNVRHQEAVWKGGGISGEVDEKEKGARCLKAGPGRLDDRGCVKRGRGCPRCGLHVQCCCVFDVNCLVERAPDEIFYPSFSRLFTKNFKYVKSNLCHALFTFTKEVSKDLGFDWLLRVGLNAHCQ
uniref:Uncharacterized protein n=1 Tax=Strigamia maritima TaxID=126957 RepID=T1IQN5_STRMM